MLFNSEASKINIVFMDRHKLEQLNNIYDINWFKMQTSVRKHFWYKPHSLPDKSLFLYRELINP